MPPTVRAMRDCSISEIWRSCRRSFAGAATGFCTILMRATAPKPRKALTRAMTDDFLPRLDERRRYPGLLAQHGVENAGGDLADLEGIEVAGFACHVLRGRQSARFDRRD